MTGAEGLHANTASVQLHQNPTPLPVLLRLEWVVIRLSKAMPLHQLGVDGTCAVLVVAVWMCQGCLGESFLI